MIREAAPDRGSANAPTVSPAAAPTAEVSGSGSLFNPYPLAIIVYGRPSPQGSKRHVGRGIMVEMSKYLAPWRELVHAAGLRARGTLPPLDEPVRLRMVFTVAKPQKAKRGARPQSPPDLSKLARSTEDALTNAGIWRDDARIVEYERLAKVFPNEDRDALEAPGARIVVWRVYP